MQFQGTAHATPHWQLLLRELLHIIYYTKGWNLRPKLFGELLNIKTYSVDQEKQTLD